MQLATPSRQEALAASQEAKIKQLEGVRDELNKRVRAIEVLLTSEREAAERKTKRAAEELRAAS